MRALAILGVCLFLAGAGGPARAGDAAAPPDGAAIRDVIAGQLGAFRAGDGASAFGYASPGIQAMFGNPATFMAMVRSGYQPVYQPRSVAFGALTEIGGRPVQQVHLVGPDGRATLALYFMEREPDGTWKVDGCQLTEDDAVGA